MLAVLASVCFWRLFAVLWGRAGCLLSGVERCLLLGGSKCTISMGRAIGGMEFVRCTEVVRPLESPLLEVSLYIQLGSVLLIKGDFLVKFCLQAGGVLLTIHTHDNVMR